MLCLLPLTLLLNYGPVHQRAQEELNSPQALDQDLFSRPGWALPVEALPVGWFCIYLLNKGKMTRQVWWWARDLSLESTVIIHVGLAPCLAKSIKKKRHILILVLEHARAATMEDLQSAINEQGLNVSSLPEKGRCLLATRDFYPGLSLSLKFLRRFHIGFELCFGRSKATWLNFLYIGPVYVEIEWNWLIFQTMHNATCLQFWPANYELFQSFKFVSQLCLFICGDLACNLGNF